MPHTCVIRGCKNRAVPRHGEQATVIRTVAFHRFPMKKQHALECWEHFVQEANMLDVPWKATRFSRICSDHFHTSDYVVPPSTDWQCKLRQCVVPSKSTRITSYPTMADELQYRLDFSKKRPAENEIACVAIPPTDQRKLSPPEKIPKTATTDTFPSMVFSQSIPVCRFWLGGGLDPGERR